MSDSSLENPEEFPAAVWELTDGATGRERLERFARLLVAEGELRGLIGPREIGRLWSRHIVNSMVLSPLIPAGRTVGDVGTGAGFPGLVLAAIRDDLTMTLIEPMERRSQWLVAVISELGLTNCQVLTARAEELRGEFAADVVTSRAVAPLHKLIAWTAPLVRQGGRMLALKGERAAEELEASRGLHSKWGITAGRVHEVASPLDGAVTRVVELEVGVARAR